MILHFFQARYVGASLVGSIAKPSTNSSLVFVLKVVIKDLFHE